MRGLSPRRGRHTGAALIMVAVFAGFATGEMVELQQLGLGLGAAVILDATVVRVLLVPSLMALLGRWNWYLPAWLSWIPETSVEGDGAKATDAELVKIEVEIAHRTRTRARTCRRAHT